MSSHKFQSYHISDDVSSLLFHLAGGGYGHKEVMTSEESSIALWDTGLPRFRFL